MTTYILSEQRFRDMAIEAIRNAPPNHQVTIGRPKRSIDQNKAIHAVITEYGNAINWTFANQRIDLDDLKQILVAAYRKQQGRAQRFVMGFDGMPVLLGWRTSLLTDEEAGEFIEMVSALCAEAEV